MRLVAEILYRLVIQQTVDRPGIRLRVPIVHLAPELDTPLGDDQGEDDIANNRYEGDQRIPEVKQPPKDGAN